MKALSHCEQSLLLFGEHIMKNEDQPTGRRRKPMKIRTIIAATCAVLFTRGTLTHTSAAACLLLGFVIEALYAVFAHRNAVRLV